MNVFPEPSHGRYNFGTTLIAILAVIIAAAMANRACAQPSLEEQAIAEKYRIENGMLIELAPTIVEGRENDMQRDEIWKNRWLAFQLDVLGGVGLAVKSMAFGGIAVAVYLLALLARGVVGWLLPTPVEREARPVVIPAARPPRTLGPGGPVAPNGPAAPHGPAAPTGRPAPVAPAAPDWPTAPASQPTPQARPTHDVWADPAYRAYRRREARAAELAERARRQGRVAPTVIVSTNGHGQPRQPRRMGQSE